MRIAAPPRPQRAVLYLVDRPGALQSYIVAGGPAPARNADDEIGINTFNNVFGGSFNSRINMNLREDKHWSYGAGSGLDGRLGPRTFRAIASVQTDKTKESVVEMAKELRQMPETIRAEALLP